MSTSFTETSLTRRLLVVVVVALVAFVWLNIGSIMAVLGGLRRAALVPLLGGLVLSGAAMGNRALLNRAAHGAVGLDVGLSRMLRTATVGFAANKIIRSAGVSGLAVFLRHGRRQGFASGAVTASCLIASVAGFAALGALLVTAISLLAVTGGLTGWWLAAASGFAVTGSVLAVVTWVAARNRGAATRLWVAAANRCPRFLSSVTGGRDGAGVGDLYDALALARADRARARRVFVHALISKALGAAMLLAATIAAGIRISPATVVIVYAAALVASLVAIVPSGLGVVEASTGALLVSSETPIAAAALAVALFRLFDLWLPVLAGAWLGRADLRSDGPSPTRSEGAGLAGRDARRSGASARGISSSLSG